MAPGTTQADSRRPRDYFDSLAVDLPNDVLGRSGVSAWGERLVAAACTECLSMAVRGSLGFSDLGVQSPTAAPHGVRVRCELGSGVNETTVIGIDADQCRSACASDPSCCVFAWSPAHAV